MRSNQLSYTATNEKNLCQAGQDRLDTGPHSEPPTGIDPVTSFLPRTRSTTELGGQRVNTLPEDLALNKSAAEEGSCGLKTPEIQAWIGLRAPFGGPFRAFQDADVTKRTHGQVERP